VEQGNEEKCSEPKGNLARSQLNELENFEVYTTAKELSKEYCNCIMRYIFR